MFEFRSHELYYQKMILQEREVLRSQQYGQMGAVLASTAERLGQAVDSETRGKWINTLSRLPYADDISETNPDLLSPTSLLEILETEESPELLLTASSLLKASSTSRTASSLAVHFASRKIEAINCVELLEYQSSDAVRRNTYVWSQLKALTIFGTFYDDIADCKEDAQVLTQFSANQLAVGAMIHAIKSLKDVEPHTLKATYLAANENGSWQRIMHRLLKPVIGAAT